MSIILSDFDLISEICRDDFTSLIAYIDMVFHYHKKVQVSVHEDYKSIANILDVNIPKWVKGVTVGNKILLVKESGWNCGLQDELWRILVHEYVHTAVADKIKEGCPCWLNEGLAYYFSGQYLMVDMKQCSLEYDYYQKGYDDDRFYEQSAYITSLLINKYGVECIINEAVQCELFREHPIFGVDSLKGRLK